MAIPKSVDTLAIDCWGADAVRIALPMSDFGCEADIPRGLADVCL